MNIFPTSYYAGGQEAMPAQDPTTQEQHELIAALVKLCWNPGTLQSERSSIARRVSDMIGIEGAAMLFRGPDAGGLDALKKELEPPAYRNV